MYDVVTTPRGPNPTLLFKAPPGPTIARWKVHRSWRKREKEVVQEWNRFPWRGERQGQKAINLYHSNSVMVDADMARVPIGPRMANPPSGLYPIVRGFDEGPGPHPWFRGASREDVARIGNREGIMDYQSRHAGAANLVRGTEPTGAPFSLPAGTSRRSSTGSLAERLRDLDLDGDPSTFDAERLQSWRANVDRMRIEHERLRNTGSYTDGPESDPSRFAGPLAPDTGLENPNPPVDPVVSEHPEDAEAQPPGGRRPSTRESRRGSDASSTGGLRGVWRAPTGAGATSAGTGNQTPDGRADPRSSLLTTVRELDAVSGDRPRPRGPTPRGRPRGGRRFDPLRRPPPPPPPGGGRGGGGGTRRRRGGRRPSDDMDLS